MVGAPSGVPAASTLQMSADRLSTWVWICPLADTNWIPDEAVAWLEVEERNRYHSFAHPLAARRFLLGRTILRSELARLMGQRPHDVKLAYSPNGKPSLAGDDQPCFSVSHCVDTVAVAVAPFAIGVDVEKVLRPRQPWKRPASFLHPREAAHVSSLPLQDQAQAFAVRWTCQEAAVKLLDSSIFNASSRILFDEQLNSGECGGHRLHFRSWRLYGGAPVDKVTSSQPGEILSVASLSVLAEVELHRWPS